MPGFPLVGLLRCGECGCSITAEKQKGHTYYRCTKKRGACSQPYVREELLADDLRAIARKFVLAEDWDKLIMAKLDACAQEEANQTTSARDGLQRQLNELGKKMTGFLMRTWIT